MTDNLNTFAAQIVTAYVANNQMTTTDLPDFIGTVHAALHGLTGPAPAKVAKRPRPAVPIRLSVTPDFIVCLEDGLRFKALTRHLSAKYSLTPEQYRQKWGLPASYPMLAPNYAAERSIALRKFASKSRPGNRRRSA